MNRSRSLANARMPVFSFSRSDAYADNCSPSASRSASPRAACFSSSLSDLARSRSLEIIFSRSPAEAARNACASVLTTEPDSESGCMRERRVPSRFPTAGTISTSVVPGGGSSKSFRSAFCASWKMRSGAMTIIFSFPTAIWSAMRITRRASSTENSPYRNTIISGLFSGVSWRTSFAYARDAAIPASRSPA